ncbi:MAG: hypothetical protein AB1Z19_00770 [Eubacteriales bacterium]
MPTPTPAAMGLPSASDITNKIAEYLPAGFPEWAVFVIAGAALAIVIFILVKIGDILFKLILAAGTIILIYLIVSGTIDIPGLTPFFNTMTDIIVGWFTG